ncbi:MAG: hypothetical protein ACK5Y2_10660 [Bdellovibrionales bacterium]
MTHSDQCEVCGNSYDKMMIVLIGYQRHQFDSFECAIHALAPHCQRCDVRILRHGHEKEGLYYCCASCARLSGETRLRDRVPENPSAFRAEDSARIQFEP